MKTITICDKECEIKCNAFTRFQYKEIFKKGIFADIKVLNEFSKKQEKMVKYIINYYGRFGMNKTTLKFKLYALCLMLFYRMN